ncbi:hypothetical protein WNY37_06345 [Henriciella sp. AS95]|uniref:hypothetical protein n=1 Tax=Henriciella sp. AS95 TaxID=3135782 RepID=UPI003181C248
MMKPLVTFAGLAILVGAVAQAEPCNKSTFSSKTGEAYLEAETALMEKNDPAAALPITTALWTSNLNCFERDSVRKLRAAVFVELKDFGNAISLLDPIVSDESQPREERARTAYNIGQLYRAMGNVEAGAPYLALSEKLKAE